MNKDNPPAFPIVGQWGVSEQGMTLRDYFAAKAMQSFIERAPDQIGFGTNYPENNLNYSRAAYVMADAMLETRK